MIGARLLLLALGVASAAGWPAGELRYYWSAVDGSRQAYGLYLPQANAPSEGGFPVVMHAHGYGWYAGADFSPWQRQWADDHGWVLINVNGRGPNFYDGIGEDDVLRVLEDVGKIMAVDRTRVFITGGSMGGTGAYRMGVRRPDVFSSAAPVDGWTDYRLYHKHWYERKDMPDAFEEFRRPLLEAASPLFVAGTARWGDMQLIVDGLDTIVDPPEGLRLNDALYGEQLRVQDGYRHELVYHPNLGHGGGYDLQRIYKHFLGVAGLARPPAVTIQATLLRYGEVHWARLERLRIQGAMGRLEAEVSGTAVHVTTQNLDGFGLKLGESPLRGEERVQVVADGLPCYEGPPADVSFVSLRNEGGGLLSWRQAVGDRPALTKRPGLEGPIGEAFLHPFAVAWASSGETAAVLRAQREAQDFAREWNEFNVHYEAVRARPEDELTADELASRNLILFGTLASSSLLRRMDAAMELPVRAFGDRVIVRDPDTGDRVYWGAKYGAYWVYPNPLNGFRTLVVGLSGHYQTTADGGAWRGLGYDLEKLQWAWGDYVVFDSDQSDLAYVGNVNNKAATLCYEAGYFVEAGFFDQGWQPDRSLELTRVRATRPERSRLIHVDSVEAAQGSLRVRAVDEGGQPVSQARVTLSWVGLDQSFSRPADKDGWAAFPPPSTPATGQPRGSVLRGEVVNVCATGATYSWSGDRARTAVLGAGEVVEVAAEAAPAEVSVMDQGCATFSVRVRNQGTRPMTLTFSAPAGPGAVTPMTQEMSVAAGGTGEARFVWDASGLAPGSYQVTMAARCATEGGQAVVRTAVARFAVEPVREVEVEVSRVGAPDRSVGEGWEVTAEVRSKNAAEPMVVTVACVLVEARRHLPTQTVRLEPGATAALRWAEGPGGRALERGIHTARVSVSEAPGAAGDAQFVVR